MKKLVVFLISSFMGYVVVGQTTFNNGIDPFGEVSMGRSVVEIPSGYAFVSWGYSPFYPWVCDMFSVTDDNGQLVSTIVFGDDTLTHYMGFQETLLKISDTTFLIAGTFNAPTFLGDQAFALMINLSGDTLWDFSYGGPGTDSFVGGKCTGDSVIYLYGHSVAGSPSGDREAFVVKLSVDGQFRWAKYYGTSSDDVLGDMSEIEGNLYFSGYSKGFGSSIFKPYLLKITTEGSFVSHRIYESSGVDNFGLALEESLDGNLIYVGTKDTVINSTDFYRSVFISKIDTSGNQYWRTYFNDSLESAINSIAVNSDGSVLFAGTKYAPGYVNLVGWVGMLSSTGSLEWDRTYNYGGDGGSRLSDILVDKNGSLVAVGETHDSVNNQIVWLVKLDSMGCLEPGCDTLTGIIDISPPKEQIAVKVFPNPASEQAIIVLEGSMAYAGEELEVYVWSLNGQLVQKKSFQINGALPILQLQRNIETSGIYLIDVVHEGKPVGSGKLLWE